MATIAEQMERAAATRQKGFVKNSSSRGSSDGAPAYTLRNPPVRPTIATWKRKSTVVNIQTRSAIKAMANRSGYANTVTNLIDYTSRKCKDV